MSNIRFLPLFLVTLVVLQTSYARAENAPAYARVYELNPLNKDKPVTSIIVILTRDAQGKPFSEKRDLAEGDKIKVFSTVIIPEVPGQKYSLTEQVAFATSKSTDSNSPETWPLHQVQSSDAKRIDVLMTSASSDARGSAYIKSKMYHLASLDAPELAEIVVDLTSFPTEVAKFDVHTIKHTFVKTAEGEIKFPDFKNTWIKP